MTSHKLRSIPWASGLTSTRKDCVSHREVSARAGAVLLQPQFPEVAWEGGGVETGLAAEKANSNSVILRGTVGHQGVSFVP